MLIAKFCSSIYIFSPHAQVKKTRVQPRDGEILFMKGIQLDPTLPQGAEKERVEHDSLVHVCIPPRV